MTITPGIVAPVPVVTIGGQVLAQGPGSGGPAGLVALDGLAVDWGRDQILDQPEPSTGTLRVFDPGNVWATKTDRRGQAVTLAWTADVGGAPVTEIFFRGRVGSPGRLSRKTVTYPDGTKVAGSVVTLPLQSILVDYANSVPVVAWPAETLVARAARIAAATGLTVTITGRTVWRDAVAAPVAAGDQVSLWDHLVNLFNSCGADRLTYLPNAHEVRYVTRREQTTSRSMGQLWWDDVDGARYGQGAYVRSYGPTAWSGSGTLIPPLYVDAAALEYDPADGLAQPAKITRLQLSHPDAAAAYALRVDEALVDGTNEAVDGVRAARLDSLVASNADAAQALADLEKYVLREGSQWRPQTLRWTTRKTGGFESIDQARAMLRGAETEEQFFLQRSWVAASYGIRPLFGLIGGRIAFERGGWDLELEPAPISLPSAQHAITFEQIDDGSATYQLQWWDDDHPRGLHESVTFEDLGFVGRGLAVAAVPSDTGWDQVQ